MTKTLGFSLFELIITLLVISILTAILFPSQQHLLQSNEAKLTSAELLHAIEVARSEAILKSNPIVLTKVQEWSQGFVIKQQNKILYEFHPSAHGTIYWRSFPCNRSDLEFLPTGDSNV